MTPTEQPKTENENTDFSRKFDLKFGYQDKEDTKLIHREVVINRRPTATNLFKATEDGIDGNAAESRINLSLITSAITKFGDITMPVPLTVIFTLNEIDESKLNDEYLLFLISTQPETEQKVLEDNRVQLAFGIERDGVKYNIVKFGKLLSGFDRMKIQNESQSDWQFIALKMAREVVELSTLDGSKSVSGEISLTEIEAMDLTDFLTMREAESQWLDSFRD